MAAISASTAAYYNSLSASKGSDWLSGAVTAIKNSSNPAGILGALANSGSAGTISGFLGQSSAFANNFATIAQTNVTNYGSYYAQIASGNQQSAVQKKIVQALKALSSAQNQVKPHNTLPSFIYLGNGSSIDTNNNILTKSNGTQIDIATGAEVIDPASIIQLANGSYLNTQTNILTLTDGTKIDTVTGLKVDTSA